VRLSPISCRRRRSFPNWSTSTWRILKSGKPFTPDFNKTLAEQGLQHKDVLRMQTPGLHGINGTCF
jgi:phenol hydroxylase P4 protein